MLIIIITILLFINTCGTTDVNNPSYCLPVENSSYVAATHDLNGSPWQIIVTPGSFDITCSQPGKKINLEINANVLDSYGNLKPGIVTSVQTTNPQAESVNFQFGVTDSCGNINFTIEDKCPERATVGYLVYIVSGSLRSDAVEVSITLGDRESSKGSDSIISEAKGDPTITEEEPEEDPFASGGENPPEQEVISDGPGASGGLLEL